MTCTWNQCTEEFDRISAEEDVVRHSRTHYEKDLSNGILFEKSFAEDATVGGKFDLPDMFYKDLNLQSGEKLGFGQLFAVDIGS